MNGDMGTVYHELGEAPCSVVALLTGASEGTEEVVGDTIGGVELANVNVDVGEVKFDDSVGDAASLTIAREGAGDADFVMDDTDGEAVGDCVTFTDGFASGTEVGLEVVASGLFDGASVVFFVGDLVGLGVSGCDVGTVVTSTRTDSTSMNEGASISIASSTD